ncbi:phage protease [Propionivibrio sp.]|uniref:phage protease n=1 Tax=Propionivibrio sp. TaxID=2212460 RepID=UPI0039E3D125
MSCKSRIIRLEAPAERTVRFLSGLHVQLEDGVTRSWVTITRTGTFTDPRYGKFDITREMLLSMVANFEANTYGQDIFVDVGHKPQDGAAAKVVRLAVEGDRLRAQVEWTPYGIDAVKNKGMAYLSAEYHENFRDNETGTAHGCVLLGAGLVTRPCIKRLDPVQLSEADAGAKGAAVLLHPTLLTELLSEVKHTMEKHLKQLEEQLRARKLSDAAITSILAAARQALTGMSDDATMKSLCDALLDGAVKLAEGTAPVINITGGGLTATDVTRILAETEARKDDAAKKLAETLDGHRKILADAINAATGFDADTKAKLLADAAELVTAAMSADQVKRLAEHMVRVGNDLAVARQLSAQGFRIAGTAHITVDDSNSIKALQEAVDKRLRLSPPKDSANKELVDAALALYDAEHAAQLHREHKQLAGGDGIISDVSVPAAFERTVIREALYPLVALQFVNVGTAEFGGSLQIPYSYRDTTAAGRDATRKYEGQGIARAGIKQAMDTAYPLPQKLAFEVSDELRYLTATGRIDFEAVAENVRNAARIIGEDTERLLLNEMVNAGDEFAVTTVATETLTSQVNGTNKVFVLANFPVVKPRKIFDLQGNQVGSTANPITVTLNSVARLEYDGTGTQAAGTYWTLDYNLGELRFVTEAGVAVAPTSAWALVVGYGYTTNVYKFDTDLGSLTAGAKWDDFLYRYGLRRSVLEDQRFYRANFGLMAGTIHEMILLANQFKASDARGQTAVNAAGDLGPVRSVPNYKSFAPGLQLADTRVLIGERANTRYRMAKPWAMGELQDQRDSNGRFTGKKEAYGDQFVFLHTPAPLKGCYTSVVLYSATGRVARAA